MIPKGPVIKVENVEKHSKQKEIQDVQNKHLSTPVKIDKTTADVPVIM